MVSWTDGYFFALMWPDLPELVRCPHCGALLWISDQELLGDRENGALEGDRHDGRGVATSFLERRRRREEFEGAQTCWLPEEDDFYDLLGRGGLSRRRERYLRLKAWRLGNDARRECAEMPRGMVLRKKDPVSFPLAKFAPMMLVLPYLANTSGWILTEIGRQPWLVFGLMKTADAVSPSITTGMVLTSLIIFTILYGILMAADVYLLAKYARDVASIKKMSH